MSAAPAGSRGRLKVAATSAVYTIARLAEMLGEAVDLLDAIADQFDGEGGCLVPIPVGTMP